VWGASPLLRRDPAARDAAIGRWREWLAERGEGLRFAPWPAAPP
jgi:hypothetical protein